MRTIKPGDVLFRFLPEYQVWHTGIVIIADPNKQHWDHIHVLEFDDTDRISKVPLRQYLWFRKYFWVTKFENEYMTYGKSVFKSRRERIRTAMELFATQPLTYTIHKYNCEYFVRRCVFNDEKLWQSPQTVNVAKTRIGLWAKLANVALFNMLYKIDDNLEFEKKEKNHEHRYHIDKKGNVKYISE